MALLTISIIFLCWFGLISCQRNHTLNLRILSSKIPELDGRDFDTYDLHPKQFKLPSFSTDYGSQRMNSNDELEDGIDADGWWEVKYSKHSVFDLLRKYKLYIRRSEIDINMIHSCYEYKVSILVMCSEVSSVKSLGLFAIEYIIILHDSLSQSD